ncbi:MAG: pteridine reductase [Isosphaeraceae bacterium]
MNLKNKIILITGGRRVGGELARLLSPLGTSVAMTYHTSREAIEQILQDVRAQGVGGLAVQADLRNAKDATRAVAETVARFGRLDALVNMASIYRRTPLAALVADDFDSMIAANLAAPYHTSIAAARQMLTQPADADSGLKGKIVNVGDWATDRPHRDYLPYLVAKGGLKTLTMALAVELAPQITVNLVQPAMIEPPPDFSEEDRAAVIAATPLRRAGEPGDLNKLILYLLTGTDFATGSCYRVDGGRFLGPGC